MRAGTRWAVTGGVALATALVGGGFALAASSDDDARPDRAITGPALETASAAALRHVGDPRARVTDTEVDDEEGAYEVEVTRADGTQIDVHLDADFTVLSDQHDGDEPDSD